MVGIALAYTMIRTGRLQRKFSGQAVALSLQKCVELHEAVTEKEQAYTLEPYANEEGAKALGLAPAPAKRRSFFGRS